MNALPSERTGRPSTHLPTDYSSQEHYPVHPPLPQGNQSSWMILAIGIIIGATMMGGVLFLIRRPDPPPIVLHPPPTPLPSATPLPTSTPAPITVFVSGAVRQPGIYELAADSRIANALQRAGGLSEQADSALINQAERLWDGVQVHVPEVGAPEQVVQPAAGLSGEKPAVASVSGYSGLDNSLININTASVDELVSLPGIGQSRAEDIIAARPFASVEDLVQVSGIGEKTLERLRDLVTVR